MDTCTCMLSHLLLWRSFFLTCILSCGIGMVYGGNPDGDFRIEVITGFNLVVDSNIESSSAYSPTSFYIGAQFCNDGSDPLTDILINIGDFTNKTPGIYPIETKDESALGYSYSGDFQLTHVAQATDASRYIDSIPAGECITQYWLVTYSPLDENGNSVTGAQADLTDDLQMTFDIWAKATDNGSNLEANVTRIVTCRNQISSAANKIWPGNDNKVPAAYQNIVDQNAGWDLIVDGNLNVSICPGEVNIIVQGIWYDLGNINKGFDNDGDFQPDYNVWLQPIGNPDLFNSDCFRLVRTYGILIIKKKSGGELLIPFEDELYFSNIPPNTGGVGLVYYEFAGLDGPCTTKLTPYQEAASGSNNEKFNADFGLGLELEVLLDPTISLEKTVSPVAPTSLSTTLTYTLAFENAAPKDLADPQYGLGLVVQDEIPANTQYILGSAALNNTLPHRVSRYSILYSTDSAQTWTATEPSVASDVTHIQWWLSDPLLALESGDVTFKVRVPSSYPDPVCINTGFLSFGNNRPFDQDTALAFMPGINELEGTVFQDDGGNSGTEWNEIQDGDEVGIASVSVRLYFDTDGNGVANSYDPIWGSATTDANGNYQFQNLPDGEYVVLIDADDPSIPAGYAQTSSNSHAVSLDPDQSNNSPVIVQDIDLGFGPILRLDKSRIGPASVYEGDTLGFLLTLTNRSNEQIGSSPLLDTYDADKLTFLYANPVADSNGTGGASPYTNTGSIHWSDVGYIAANSDSFTTVVPVAGHWAMEEGSGLTAIDSSSSGLDMTLKGGASWVAGKESDYALELDGTNDYAVTADVNLGLGTNFAFGLWINVDQIDQMYILSNGVPGSSQTVGEFDLQVTNTGDLTFGWYDGSYQSAAAGVSLGTNTWYHVLVNYDGTNLQFYLNGSLAGTHEIVGIDLLDTNQQINVGTKRDRSYSYDGTIDDIRIYQDNLIPQQINRLINLGTIEVPQGLEVYVYFRANEPDTDGELTINEACVSDALLINNGEVNDDCDTAQVIILDAGSISGYIWSDADGDGWQGTTGYEVGEQGIPFIRVVLEGCASFAKNGSCLAGYTTDTVYSDTEGLYSFTGLVPDRSYRIHVLTDDIPDTSPTQTGDPDDDPNRGSGNGNQCGTGKLNSTCDDTWDNADSWFNLEEATWGSESMDLTEINFGYQIDIIVYGQVWEDVNGDSIKQANEPGIQNISLSLDGMTKMTDANGNYSFGDLSSQSYTILVGALPAVGGGWNQTAETDLSLNKSITISPASGSISGSHDFGFQAFGIADIGDQLYYDWNGNGVHESNEEGIRQINISLYRDINQNGIKDDNDTFLDSTETSTDGSYLFADYPIGTYLVLVDESDPQFPQSTQTGDPDDIGICSTCDGMDSVSVLGTADVLRSDFGYQPVGAGSIGDLVWYDANGDGQQVGNSEIGLALITVFLYADLNSDGVYLLADSAETDGQGNYRFDNLPDGLYQIIVDSTDVDMPRDGANNLLNSTTGSRFDLTISGGNVSMINSLACSSCDDDIDLGFGELAAVGDMIYWDANKNGTQDWEEIGIPNVKIYLCSGDIAECSDSNALYTTTSSDGSDDNEIGHFQFTGLLPGTYTISVETTNGILSGSAQTADPNSDGLNCTDPLLDSYGYPDCDDHYAIELGYGTNFLGADFGYRPNGVIGDYVWFDQNGDGIQDNGELGHAGDTLWLCLGDGICDGNSAIDTAVTDYDGLYTFQDIADGQYSLTIEVPTNMSLSTGAESMGSTTVSLTMNGGDITQIQGTNCTDCELDIDFGFEILGMYEITGTVCLDDGSEDGLCTGIGAETPLSSLTLNLYDDFGTFYGTTTTDASGNYSFTNLLPNTYIISLGTALPPLDEATLTTESADVPTGGLITTTASSVYQLLSVSANTSNADFAFSLTTEVDFGDISVAYSGISQLAADGGRHTIPGTSTLYLGDIPPGSEQDHVSSADASADGNEEDGVDFIAPGGWTNGLSSDGNGGMAEVTVNGSGWLIGWIDFNVDGDFTDLGERIISTAVSTGTNMYQFDIPDNTIENNAIFVFSRFRVFQQEPILPDFAYTGATFDGEIEDYYLTVGGILPIDLLEFEAKLINHERVIQWRTALELNSDYFEIERSEDRIQFFPIDQVSAAGQSSEILSYTYTDRQAIVGSTSTLYYRLKSVDIDGTYTYSEVEELTLPHESDLLVYAIPNMVEDRFEIHIRQTGLGNIPAVFSVSNSFGQEVLGKQILISGSLTKVPIVVGKWAHGVYYGSLTTETRKYVVKFVVK